jgi:hypothetical protein
VAKRAHRTYWIIRQRYRRIGLGASIVGGLAAGALVAPYVHSADWSMPDEALTALQGVGMFVAAVVLPPIVARLLWWVHRRRYFDDIYQITHR